MRQKRKLSQEELAFNANIDRSYLSEVESGRKNIGIQVLAKIAAGLGVTIERLFEGYEDDE